MQCSTWSGNRTSDRGRGAGFGKRDGCAEPVMVRPEGGRRNVAVLNGPVSGGVAVVVGIGPGVAPRRSDHLHRPTRTPPL